MFLIHGANNNAKKKYLRNNKWREHIIQFNIMDREPCLLNRRKKKTASKKKEKRIVK